MTLGEFRAWLEGYSASFTDGAPNAAQWKTIAEKLEAVELFKPVNVPANSIPQIQSVQSVFPYAAASLASQTQQYYNTEIDKLNGCARQPT
jgi:hypothetical protein